MLERGPVSRILFPAPPPSYGRASWPQDLIWIPRARRRGKGPGAAPAPGAPAPEPSAEDRIPCLLLTCPSARFLVIYFHSNAEDLGRCRGFCRYLRQQFQVHVLAVEYPGYGACPGIASGDSVMENALSAAEFARGTLKWPLDSTMVFGRSIGTGPATALASMFRIAGLILVTPFMSIRELFRDRVGPLAGLVEEWFPNCEAASKVASPTLIIHGQRDQLISCRHGEAIYERLRGRKLLVSPPDMEHNTNLLSSAQLFVAPMFQFFALPGCAGEDLGRGLGRPVDHASGVATAKDGFGVAGLSAFQRPTGQLSDEEIRWNTQMIDWERRNPPGATGIEDCARYQWDLQRWVRQQRRLSNAQSRQREASPRQRQLAATASSGRREAATAREGAGASGPPMAARSGLRLTELPSGADRARAQAEQSGDPHHTIVISDSDSPREEEDDWKQKTPWAKRAPAKRVSDAPAEGQPLPKRMPARPPRPIDLSGRVAPPPPVTREQLRQAADHYKPEPERARQEHMEAERRQLLSQAPRGSATRATTVSAIMKHSEEPIGRGKLLKRQAEQTTNARIAARAKAAFPLRAKVGQTAEQPKGYKSIAKLPPEEAAVVEQSKPKRLPPFVLSSPHEAIPARHKGWALVEGAAWDPGKLVLELKLRGERNKMIHEYLLAGFPVWQQDGLTTAITTMLNFLTNAAPNLMAQNMDEKMDQILDLLRAQGQALQDLQKKVEELDQKVEELNQQDKQQGQ
ncbi:unnamed protein product [Prorocentrum cordatum]|uniref:Serine aminopeptidase S33 domain-containing protein n=1 Tax=Prorocentrum cordatum TaxID=2364126 RepID=A0ABN9XWH2_9DINO|nr:unnamed protein product [Polarella glacialis]